MTDEAQNTTPTNTEVKTEPTSQTATTVPETKVVGSIIADAPAQTIPTEPQTFDIASMLPEELRNEPSLKGYKDVASMAKSLVHAQKELGSRVRIPSADASKEAKAEFYKKLEMVPGVVVIPEKTDQAGMEAFLTKIGRPKSPDEYKVDLDPDVVKYVPGLKDKVPEFKVLAHKLGLNAEQAMALVEFETKQTSQVIDRMLEDREKTQTTLKANWGSDYDNRLKAASDLFSKMSTKYPEATKALLNGVEGNNPVVIEMAAELGKAYRESGLITGTSEVSFGHTPSEAKERIEELKANPEFQAKLKSRDEKVAAEARDKLTALYEAAYPTDKK